MAHAFYMACVGCSNGKNILHGQRVLWQTRLTWPTSIVVMANAFCAASVDCSNGRCILHGHRRLFLRWEWVQHALVKVDAKGAGMVEGLSVDVVLSVAAEAQGGRRDYWWVEVKWIRQMHFTWPAPVVLMANAFYMASVNCSNGKCILHGKRRLFYWQMHFTWRASIVLMANAFYITSVDCSNGKCILHGQRRLF